MNWPRLKRNLCPKCESRKTLEYDMIRMMFKCEKCDFNISSEKFRAICADRPENKTDEEEQTDKEKGEREGYGTD